jgi:hypothetical protein
MQGLQTCLVALLSRYTSFILHYRSGTSPTTLLFVCWLLFCYCSLFFWEVLYWFKWNISGGLDLLRNHLWKYHSLVLFHTLRWQYPHFVLCLLFCGLFIVSIPMLGLGKIFLWVQLSVVLRMPFNVVAISIDIWLCTSGYCTDSYCYPNCQST